MKYKLVIFDLDGTILDTLEDLAGSLNYALSQNGFPLRSLAEVRSFVGNGIRNLIERGVPADTPSESAEKVYQDFTVHYKLHCADNTKPYDGIKELLLKLRHAGVKTAVVSNKADYAVSALCKQFFPDLFDATVGEQPAVKKKPAPDSVNAVLTRLGIGRKDSVYIGDSEVDIETALNAGMDCISVCWGFRQREYLKANGAAVIVSEPKDIFPLI